MRKTVKIPFAFAFPFQNRSFPFPNRHVCVFLFDTGQELNGSCSYPAFIPYPTAPLTDTIPPQSLLLSADTL